MLMLPEREILPSLEQLNYEILEWIPTKSDGMARLVKTRSESGDIVTIKIARVDPQDAVTEKHNQAIISESACLHELSESPGVVPILPTQDMLEDEPSYYQRLNEDGEPAYLVQPFLAGATLSRFVGTDSLEPLVALKIGLSLARTLASIHSAGWVHRDLKPSNIMFAQAPSAISLPGGGDLESFAEPILIDFGIAARAETEIVAEGTISWMAPEVREAFDSSRAGTAQSSCDIYGLGLLLCYMLSGVRPTIDRSSQENRDALRTQALSTRSHALGVDTKARADLTELIDSLLNVNAENRPSARLCANKISAILAKMQRPLTLSKRFVMYKKRYAPSIWRLTGSIAVALFTILLGRQLFLAPDDDGNGAIDVVAVVESQATATATIEPPQGFPSAQGAATATLLPSLVNSSVGSDGGAGNEEQGSASSSNARSGRSQTSSGSSVDGNRAGANRQAGNENERLAVAQANRPTATVIPEQSGLGWLPDLSLPRSLLGRLSWLATPEPQPTATIAPIPTEATLNSVVAGITPRPTVTPTTNPYIFPEVAAIVEITGDEHPCFLDWQMTDTWNKDAPGSRVALRWRRINRTPFDAEAKFQIGIALEPNSLLPYKAIPISPVVKDNHISVDPLNALWAINGLVERKDVVNRPYVWGVFLVGASGRMVTRVSPVCYFQLDGEMIGILPNE